MRVKKKGKFEIAQLLSEFQQTVLNNRPSYQEMFEEVRMMHFKVRPLNGDISQLQTLDSNLVEALWNIGKFDEFFKTQRTKLTKSEQDMFLKYFETLYTRLQKEMNGTTKEHMSINDDSNSTSTVVEMEIYRERINKKHIN